MSVRSLPVVVLLFLLVATGWPAAAQQPARAVQGQVVLGADTGRPVPLAGEWAFAWERFVDPQWQQLPASAFAPVPSSWNAVRADGKPAGENGWGSYLLQVNCPPGRTLALDAAAQRTASRLFVNGTLVAQHGTPGPGPQASHAAVHERVPITREFACPLRITLHVSNFDHRAGGFVRPISAGSPEVLQRARESRLVYGTMLLAGYLLTGLVALIFFVVRRREHIPLVFGLFCLAMAVYTDLIGERLLLRLVGGQVSWFAYMRVEYLSWLAAMALFFLTLRGLFPTEIHRRVVQGVLGTLSVAAVAVLVLPPAVYSYLAAPGQGVAVLVGAYIVWAMLRATDRNRIDARVLLAGMAAVLVGLAVDLLLIETLGPDRKFSPVAFALFLLSPAAVIARRLHQALNAEERSRALEENARLREDVERISRHDLKTPLNSILGAARLLRDDGKLTRDQQELVGVLQRAGLRMLEMVNLSLGLFRMETGSYQLKPEAVDLRELVSRVLVDLHPYAEANRVVLSWQASGPEPVYVRGEELLCYSILANVLKNAVEAAGAGEQVSIVLAPGDPVAVSVHNPGTVPPEVASRFFEKYVTGRKSGGTGLGTYSARLMARAQHGDLQMRTGAAGTTVTLTLQPAKEPARLPSAPADVKPPPAGWLAAIPPRQALVVDDDEFTRLVTRRMLPHPPFTAETAANGQAAVEAMAVRWPDYLLVDMEMPLMGGVETVRWVREQEASAGRPRCRIIMVSGNDDDASIARGLEAGADRFLTKPLRWERLIAVLRELEDVAPSDPAPLVRAPADADQPERKVKVDPEWREHFAGFMDLQRETAEGMARAVAEGDRKRLKFLAHRAYGGLGAMNLHWAARQSRRLENAAEDGPLAELQAAVDALRDHLGTVEIDYA
jgi:signal transduction histidine kinase/DNA-binding response OmpR family regulator